MLSNLELEDIRTVYIKGDEGKDEMGKILVVDDEIEGCNALKEFLSLKEYEVVTALDGATVLEKIEQFKPHIVLLDILMPGLGGLDVLLRIKK